MRKCQKSTSHWRLRDFSSKLAKNPPSKIGASHRGLRDFSSELTKNTPLEIGTSRGELCHGLDWCMETTAASPRIPSCYYISSASNFNANQNLWKGVILSVSFQLQKRIWFTALLNLQQLSMETIPANHTIRRGYLPLS